MSGMGFVNAAIEAALKDMHCAYIGKVTWTDGETATVQPLGKIKEYGSTATKSQALVSNIPVACRYKLTAKSVTLANGSSQKIAVPEEIEKGDLVVCVCCDRDITDARRGKNELPPAGMHDISDSIVVGIL